MKKGISLIVLVITIIVMIILAATVVISLSNTGIINKANRAVNKMNIKEVQNLADLVWGEEYLAGKTGEELEDAVLLRLDEYKDNYYIEVTENGAKVYEQPTNGKFIPIDWRESVWEITEDDVPIPIGFVKSPYENEGTKNGGLVIYALTPEEISNGITTISEEHQDALEERNQFVWIPVDSEEFKNVFKRIDKMNTTSQLTDKVGENQKFWELVLTEDNLVSQNIQENLLNYISITTLAEATAMYQSVKKYGGFYIARYEAGTSTTYESSERGWIATRVSINQKTNTELTVTMGKYPYNVLEWGTSMSDESSDDKAVSLARAFYPKEKNIYGVVSTLTYGVQWDRVIGWYKEQDDLDGKEDINLKSSKDYGVYKDTLITSEDLNKGAQYSIYNAFRKFNKWAPLIEKNESGAWILTTGAYKKANVYNIYDMAGNVWEWTMEGYDETKRCIHGGYFDNVGTHTPIVYRHYTSYDIAGIDYGFRPALYIK